MADVARWKTGAEGLVRAEDRVQRSRFRPLDGLTLTLTGLILTLFYAKEKLKRRAPKGWRTEDGVRAMLAYQPLLPGEAMPHPGVSLLRRVRARRPAVVHPVRLVLYRDGTPYGIDEGVVEFRDGLLRYEGDATAFALKPEDASLLPDAFIESAKPDFYETRFRYGNLATRRAWAFDLAADPAVRVYLYNLRGAGGDPAYRPLFDWLMEPPAAKGETLLPPIDALPGFKPPKSLDPGPTPPERPRAPRAR